MMSCNSRLLRVIGLGLCLAVAADADPRAGVMDSVIVLRRARDLGAATSRLQAWIDSHPDDGDARMLLGQVLADSGDEDAAQRTWTDLLQAHPVDVERYRAVVTRLQTMGRLEEAIDLLREGTERLGSADPFSWQRAELLLSVGDWAGAVEAHRTFLRQEPHRRPLVENRIAALARADAVSGVEGGRAHRYRDALQAASAGVRGAEATMLTLLRAGCSLEIGDPQAGLRTLRDALDGDDAILQALFQFASRCEAAGHADVAARAYGLFASHARDSPYRARALLQQAEMLALAGNMDGAVALYVDLSAGADAESSEAMLRVAQLQLQTLHDPDAALATLATLERRVPVGELRRRMLGLRAGCRLQLDDLPGAAAEWRRLAADPEGRANSEFGLAELAFFEARFDSSAALLDSLVAREPSHPLANDALDLLLLIDEFGSQAVALAGLARARLHGRQGRLDEARRDREWLLQVAPAGLRHLSLLESAARLEISSPERSLELYSQVTDDEPDERHAVSAALGRARLLEARGAMREALRTYESTVLTAPLDPRTPDTRRHIVRLRTLLGGRG